MLRKLNWAVTLVALIALFIQIVQIAQPVLSLDLTDGGKNQSPPLGGEPTILSAPTETLPDASRIFSLWVKYQRIGERAFAQGDMDMAQSMFEQALGEAELMGAQDPRLALTLEKLATLYSTEDKLDKALSFAKRALACREKSGGPDSPEVADTLSLLASLYEMSDQSADAEPLCRRALSIKEKQFGENSPEVASTLTTLAALCAEENKDSDADALYKRAIAIYDKNKNSSAEQANVLEGYGQLLWKKGQLKNAEPLMIRAEGIRESVQGAEHSDTVETMRMLSSLFLAEGKVGLAEPMTRKILEIDHKSVDTRQSNLATDMNNMGLVYVLKNQPAQAQQMFEIALEIRNRVLGADSFASAQTLVNLAKLYRDKGENAKSEQLFLKALAIDQKTGGDELSYAQDLQDYGLLLLKTGRLKETQEEMEKALTIRQRLEGPDNPQQLSLLKNLCNLYKQQNQNQKAENSARQILAIHEKLLSEDDSKIVEDLDALAIILCASGKTVPAEALYGRSLAILETNSGAKANAIANRCLKLAQLCESDGDYAIAEEQCKKVIVILEQNPKLNAPLVASLLDECARLQRMSKKADEAVKTEAQARMIRGKLKTAEK